MFFSKQLTALYAYDVNFLYVGYFFHEKFKKLIRSPSEEAALSYP